MTKDKWQRATGNIEGVDIPEGINFFINKDENRIKIHINHPQSNMQDDKAAFEGWALIFHTKLKDQITLSFEPVGMNWSLVNSSAEETNYNYMRFLYRLWKFEEQMPWFAIDDINQNIVAKFKTEFLQLKDQKLLINNRPKQEAQLSNSDDKSEHYFENAFVRNDQAQEILKNIVKEQDGTKLKNLYNQLPNGLFKGSRQVDITNANRIFPTGFFDLWGISEQNELCLFELKVTDIKGEDVENKSVGIISQLFFYANYCRDIFLDKNCNKSQTKFRGYDKLLAAVKEGIPKVKAYFLAPQYHARIEDSRKSIENCLNMRSPFIEYKFLKYDYAQVKPFVDEIRKQ